MKVLARATGKHSGSAAAAAEPAGKSPTQARRPFPRATLNYFGEVARCNSVRQAADRLYVAPSGVSRQISKLEHFIGTPLFDRRAGGMRLTEAGQLLAEYLNRTERELDRALAAIDDLRGLISGEVSISTVEGMIDEFLPRLIEVYRGKFPAISLAVRVGSALAVMEDVAGDETDIGISFNVPARSNLLVTAQHAQPIVAVCGPRHPLATSRKASLRSLNRYPLALPDLNFGTRRLLDDAFARARLTLQPRLVSNSLTMLKAQAKQGGMVTFLPAFAVQAEVGRSELVTVPTNSATLNSARLDLCVHASRRLSSAAQEFLKLTEAALSKLP